MASYVEKTPAGVIYKAAQTRAFPRLDLLSVLFDSPNTGGKEDTILHASADDPSKCVTKAQLRDMVQRLAYTLRHTYGIGKSGPSTDVVICIATGHHLIPALFLATVAASGVFSSSSPSSTPSEFAAQITQVSAGVIFCTPLTRATALAAASLANLPASAVLSLDDLPLDPTHRLTWPRITSPTVLDDSIICVLFSSGTTGRPKAVRLSHTNMVSQAALVIDPYKESDPSGTDFSRTVAHLPAAHIAGVQGYLVNWHYAGGTVYWMERFDFPKFLAYTKKYAVTSFFSVPPIFLLIVKSPMVTDQFDTVRFALSGAAPMGRELQVAVMKKMGQGTAQVGQTWGLSETTGSMTVIPRGTPNDLTGSVSMLVSNGMARIVDDEGKDVEPGTPGEIWVQGPQVTKGYWKNDEANREAFSDGWFCTGDVGLFKDGMFYVVDRKKELIKYKANQVAPAELEALLISHPGILDAAVIGVPGEGTEVPRAYVVAADPKKLTAKEVADWVAGQVSGYKKLRGGVIFLPAIPKSPSGKILRKDLRELAKKEAKTSRL
ncbi:hypothetical protein OQA88_7123 [Cercophora sp. LCS_1]